MSRTIIDSVNQTLSTQRGENSVADRALQIWHDSQSPIPIVSAFEQLDARVDEWIQVGTLSAHGLSLALHQIQKIWDQIPSEITSKYNYDFWEYARWRTNKSQTTIANYINVARTFLSGEVELTGKPDNFDPYQVEQSTLLLAAHLAKAGKLDEKGWQILANPQTSYNQMQAEVARLRGKRDKTEPANKPRFYILDNRLVFTEDGVDVILGELEDVKNADESDKDKVPYIEHGLNLMIHRLGIPIENENTKQEG